MYLCKGSGAFPAPFQYEEMNKAKVLIVDDNAGIRATLKILLPRYFGLVEFLPSPKTLISKLKSFVPDVVLLDMNFDTDINTGNEGLYWLSEIKRMAPQIEVVLFTAYADIALAVEGMKRGAFDFVVKPFENDHLVEVLASASQKSIKKSKRCVESSSEGGMYWGGNASMKALRATVEKIAPTDANVLITGENGTGKDVLAREIHRLSDRSLQPMVSVDVGAITDNLFESELFGHVKGSFTGAYADHRGKIEEANGGTLFLDEIGNIPLHLQAKLLRVLQNRMIIRVGDTKAREVDVRLVCATNKDLEAMVRQGAFREDLYYRINTIHLHLPALRDRRDEIIPLSQLFIERYAEKYHREVRTLDTSAEADLLAHSWQGNIRELQNTIEKAVIMSGGKHLSASDLSLNDLQTSSDESMITDSTLEELEQRAIRAQMERYNGNLTMVAKSLEISRPTLYSKLKKYNI